jgi:hypothetical protein
VEIHRTHPCPEDAGVAIPVSSACNYYVSNRQIHEDLIVPLFAEHRVLTASFDSKLADVVKTLYGKSADA